MCRPRPVLFLACLPCLVGICLVLSPAVARPAGVDDVLRQEIKLIAQDIKERLDSSDLKDATVVINPIVHPENLTATGGPLLKIMLQEELSKLKVKTGSLGKVTVRGHFQDVKDSTSNLLAIRIRMWLEQDGKRIGEALKDTVLLNPELVIRLMGRTIAIDPQDSFAAVSNALEREIDSPQVFVDGSVVKSNRASKFSLEVLVGDNSVGDDKPNLQPAPVTITDGLAFIKVKKPQIYAVRIGNDADHEIAVSLSIDGLNMFSFCEETNETKGPRYNCVVVGPKSKALIPGWFINNNQTDRFEVAEFARSAAQNPGLGSAADIRTIQVLVRACWKETDEPPADEKEPKGGRTAEIHTGRGQRINERYTPVMRKFGVMRDTIAVRYSLAE